MTSLEALVEAELALPPPPALVALADDIVRRHGQSVMAILFYGSCRRTGDLSGLADFYVLYSGHLAFHGKSMAALLNALLPPNVLLVSAPDAGDTVRAKVAVMSARQFGRRMRAASLDTTVWARFAQPATLIYARDEAARHWIVQTMAEGVRTAVFWSRRLAPAAATPAAQWQALFTRTYRNELRAERDFQSERLYQANAAWFDAILAATPRAQTGIRRQWLWRRLCGKPLNVLRLLKAAFTFQNGADYLAWKIERHSGVRLVLTDWQRRHPILAAPRLLWRLRRLGAVR